MTPTLFKQTFVSQLNMINTHKRSNNISAAKRTFLLLVGDLKTRLTNELANKKTTRTTLGEALLEGYKGDHNLFLYEVFEKICNQNNCEFTTAEIPLKKTATPYSVRSISELRLFIRELLKSVENVITFSVVLKDKEYYLHFGTIDHLKN